MEIAICFLKKVKKFMQLYDKIMRFYQISRSCVFGTAFAVFFGVGISLSENAFADPYDVRMIFQSLREASRHSHGKDRRLDIRKIFGKQIVFQSVHFREIAVIFVLVLSDGRNGHKSFYGNIGIFLQAETEIFQVFG